MQYKFIIKLHSDWSDKRSVLCKSMTHLHECAISNASIKAISTGICMMFTLHEQIFKIV